MKKSILKTVSALALATCFTSSLPINSSAENLVYKPVNPSFGGNPLNNGYLVGTAQIQNQFTASGGSGGGGGVPTINFPDINIDLGGIGGDEGGEETTGDDDTTVEVTTPTPAVTQ